MKVQIKNNMFAEIIKDGVLPLGDGGTIIECDYMPSCCEYKTPVSFENGNWIYNEDQDTKLGVLIKEAKELINNNYYTFQSDGLSYDYNTEYIINNNNKTRDEIDKKITNVSLGIDNDFNWTMDSPRTKINFGNKDAFLVFVGRVQSVIAHNETLLRDKKTEINNLNIEQLNSFISSPSFPTYERIV